MRVWRPQTAYALGRETGWSPLLAEVNDCASAEAVRAWWGHFLAFRHRDYPQGWSLALRDACEAREEELEAAEYHVELDEAFRATMGAA